MKAITLAALMLIGLAGPARSEDCKPLKLLNSVPLEMRGARVLVPVTINGTPQKMLLDTGGITSQISEKIAQDAKLRLHDSKFNLISVSGKSYKQEARIDEFVLGHLVAKDTDFQVTGFAQDDLAGILALNFFLSYDIDLDFGANKLNFISPEHCEGRVLYWQATTVAIVPIRVKEGHITVQVAVDGHTLDAIVDTGASRTAMSMDIARRAYNLTADGPDVVPSGDINGDPNLKSYAHVFGSLGFEGVAVRNPRILLIPDIVGKGADQRFKTGSNTKRWSDDVQLPPLTLGMDVLRRLHVYFAFKEGKMYITAAQPAAPATSAILSDNKTSPAQQ